MPNLKFMRQGIGDKVKAKGGTKKMSYSFGGRRGWLGAPDQEENSNEKRSSQSSQTWGQVRQSHRAWAGIKRL